MLDTQQAVISNPAPSILSTRAILRGVRLGLWDGRKLDKAVSDEVARAKGAKADAGRYNKQLVPPESLAAVKSAANAIRAVHARYTLPWTNNGFDILPAAKVAEYDNDMRAARYEFEKAADSFAAIYPALVDSAPARLGELFDASEFPSANEVRSRFSFRVRTLTIPDKTDFRVDMSDAQARLIRAEIEAESREALETAMADAWQRVADVCARMVERLNAYKPATAKGEKTEGRFTDTIVENVRDLVAMLPAFNLTGDPTLADVTARLERDLCANDAQTLRDDETARKEAARAAQAILDDVSAFLA